MATDRCSYLLSLRRKISGHTRLGSSYIEDIACVSPDILADMVNCPTGIKSDDWLDVRVSLGLFVSQLRGTDLHYHNIIGNNKDALMHVLGMAPMAFGAMMLTAGVLKFRKARGGDDDDKILSINKGHWESIMADAKIDDSGKMTTYGSDKTIVVSIGTMNPTRSENANKNRHRWNDIMTADDQFSSTPPIPPPRRNSFNLRVKFQQAVAPHIMGGYELLHWQANRSILEQGKKFAVAIGSDEACVHYNDDDDDANDEESSTMIDAAVLEDDDDDEDYVPAEDEHIDSVLDDEAEREFLQHYEEEHRITDEKEGPIEFHLLKRFGIDPNNEKKGDRDELKKILGEIWRANSLFAKNERKKKPTSISFSHHKTSWKGKLVLVPKVDYTNPAAGNKLFQRKTKDLGNIEEILLHVAGGKEEDKTHAARSMGIYLWRRYEKEMCEAADERGLTGVVKERFSAEKTAALIQDMGINFGQSRILGRYLKDHFEYSVLAPEPEVYSLGLGYVEPKWGEYEYKKNGRVLEVCHYWVRDVKEVVLKVTEHQFSGRGKEWKKVVRVGIVVGGDHGQGAFRVVLHIRQERKEATHYCYCQSSPCRMQERRQRNSS